MYIKPGEVRITHKSSCSYGKRMEEYNRGLRIRLDRAQVGGQIAYFFRLEEAKTRDDRNHTPRGHKMSFASGYHNPRDPEDWCYKIRCECGYEDIGWVVDQVEEIVIEHKREARKANPLPPSERKKPPPDDPPKKERTLVY